MKYLIYFLICLSPITLYSQEMIMDWDKCYGSNHANFPEGVEILPNGLTIFNITVLNNNQAFTDYHGLTDAWVAILDQNGNIIQEKCFGGSLHDNFGDIEISSDGIYFIGKTNSIDGDALSEPIGGNNDLWVVKTDFDLNIIWEKKYGSDNATMWFCSAKITQSDGLVILTDFQGQAGGDITEFYGYDDIWVFEIDMDGNMLWQKTLGNSYGNNAGNLLVTDQGTTMILGETSSSGGMVDCNCHSSDGITRDIWLTELDNQGDIIWQNCYGGSDWELGLDIMQESDGYVFFAKTKSNNGDVSGNHGGDASDYWLVNIDEIGNINWQSCYGGTGIDDARQFYITSENNYIMIGTSNSENGDVSNNHGLSDVWVVLVDSIGNIIWENSFGGPHRNSANRNSIAQKGEMDFIIAATNMTYNNSGDISCTPYPIDDNYYTWIFRLYDPTIGLEELPEHTLNVYPNPASDYIYFDVLDISKESFLLISDIFGKPIERIKIYPNQKQILWECKNQATGIYFYQTEIDGMIYRGKIIIGSVALITQR